MSDARRETNIASPVGTPALKVRKKLFARLREDSEHLVLFVDLHGARGARPDLPGRREPGTLRR